MPRIARAAGFCLLSAALLGMCACGDRVQAVLGGILPTIGKTDLPRSHIDKVLQAFRDYPRWDS